MYGDKNNMIQIIDVKKQYTAKEQNVFALKGISANIQSGEFTAISGPSGSGKTTLLNLIGCLDTITSGSIILDGVDLTQLTKQEANEVRKTKIGFVFQSYNLIPVLTAYENVSLALDVQNRYSKDEIKELSYQILKDVGLEGLENRTPGQLSGGQQQRVSVARALVKKPQIILADEPTANLDSKNAETVLQLMKELNKKRKITFLFSTHDNLVLSFVNRTLSLSDGLLVGDTNA